jgi:hypothetical protein
MRRILPQRRAAETFDLTHGDMRTPFQVSVGFYEGAEDAGPAEVFINGAKVGSVVEAVARDGAVLLSIALQHGVPLDVIQSAITRDSAGAPMSIIGAVVDKLKERP